MNLLFGTGFSKGGIITYVFLSFVILIFSFWMDSFLGTDSFVSSQLKYILWSVLPVVIVYGLWSFFKKRREEADASNEFVEGMGITPANTI